MKIVLLESLGISKEKLTEYAQKLEEQGHVFEAYEKNTDVKVQIQETKDADVIMLANMPLSGEVIKECENLKFIDVAFTGVDHVDLKAAAEKNVAVSNASGYSNESVSELVLGMAISLFRNMSAVETRCRNGETKDGLVGRELKGHTVGIIGYGAIGRRTAELFRAMGCEIYAYTRHPKENTPEYVTYVSKEELLEKSDIVTLHCPLTEETKHLIGEKELELMKADAILINAARGPVVDSQALADALNNGKIAGAAVDVFEMEPPVPTNHPLLQAKNCLVTPHVAFASKESMELRAEIVFDSLEQWMNGNQVNCILS